MTNSPNIAAIVAHVDSRGNLRCVQCHINSERKSDFAVFADNSAFHGDACDSCRKSFAPKPQPIWITRRDLYDRMVTAQNTCCAYGKPQEFDNALAFIDTEAAFIAHVEYAEAKAAKASAVSTSQPSKMDALYAAELAAVNAAADLLDRVPA